MPFKSEAQRRKIAELEEQGKVKPGTFKEWNNATPRGKLPERIGPIRTPPKSPKGGRR